MERGCYAKKSSVATAIVEYKNLRINDESFTVGDVVRIKEYSDDSSYGTLLKIWKRKDKPDPLARVRWFYKPRNIFETDYDFLSEAELFDSDHEQDIWVVCIYSKIRVLSFNDYHALDEVDDDVFFTRAKYFYLEKIIRPSFEEWNRACVCKAIVNPDHLYLCCEACSAMFHPECIGFIDREDEPYFCESCLMEIE